MKIKFTIEYDGRAFCGFQEQANAHSVQGELEAALDTYFGALSKRRGLPPARKAVINGSGRTDSGVHARGQVASFVWPEGYPFEEDPFLRALNGITVRELSILSAVPVDDHFDARFSPHRKQYSYRLLLRRGGDGLWTGRAWRIVAPLDISAMCEAAKLFVGTHDFTSYRAGDCLAKTTERKIFLSELSREDECLVYTVQGNGFLKQMIRIMVGTLVLVGKGRLRPEDIIRIRDARSRLEAGRTAPACGLTLDWVRYVPEPERIEVTTR